MMNMVRADMYAVFRGKAFYVTMAILFLMNVLVIGTGTVGGVNFGGVDGTGITLPELSFDGIGSAAILYTRTDNLVFFLLPLILVAASPIFTHSTVKNDLAWGVSRGKLYVAKLLTAMVLCAFMLFFYMVSGMLLATVLNGFGGPVPEDYIRNLLLTLGAQLFMMFAMTCFGVFLVFTTKRTGAVNGIYIAFCLVPAMIVMLLFEAGHDVIRLLDFDLFFGINRLGFLGQLDRRTVVSILGTGAFYIVATTAFGIMLFRRAEIK